MLVIAALPGLCDSPARPPLHGHSTLYVKDRGLPEGRHNFFSLSPHPAGTTLLLFGRIINNMSTHADVYVPGIGLSMDVLFHLTLRTTL